MSPSGYASGLTVQKTAPHPNSFNNRGSLLFYRWITAFSLRQCLRQKRNRPSLPVEGGSQIRNQLGTPGARRVFWEGPKNFELCPVVSKYFQHILPGRAKDFLGVLRPPGYGPGGSYGKIRCITTVKVSWSPVQPIDKRWVIQTAVVQTQLMLHAIKGEARLLMVRGFTLPK